MPRIMELQVGDEVVYVEIEQYGAIQTGAVDMIRQRSQDAFERAMVIIKAISKAMLESLRSMGEEIMPDEFRVELAIKFEEEKGVVLAKVGSEAQMKVVLIYRDQ